MLIVFIDNNHINKQSYVHSYFERKHKGLIPMSDFTKSIVYSGVVLVAGLIAIFSIYNNMTADTASNYAGISPAAGEQATTTPAFSEEVQQNLEAVMDEAGEMASDAAEAAQDAASDVAEQASEIMGDDAGNMAETATEATNDAGDMAEDISDAVGEALDKAAETASETMPSAGEEFTPEIDTKF